MSKITKQEQELSKRFEKWLYVLKNLPHLECIPDMGREKVFEEFFRLAELAEFTKDERDAYDDSLKVMRDNYAVLTTALRKLRPKVKPRV